MKVRINLKIFIFIIIFLLTKQIQIYGILMLFAFIHELGHALAGVMLGLKPSKITIMPFGFMLEFEVREKDYNLKIRNGSILELKKIIIASAGPLTNAIIAFIFYLFNIHFMGINREVIVYSNILIATFNLFTIYPLDGGRIAKSLIHILYGNKEAYQYTSTISNLSTGIITIVASFLILYIHNIAILFIVMYLWYLTWKTNKEFKYKHRIYGVIEKNKGKVEIKNT